MAVQTTYTTDSAGRTVARGRHIENKVFSKTVRIDCATTTIASGDTEEVMYVPKGAVIRAISVNVVTGEGAAETIDLGVGGALTTWLDDKSVETAGTVHAGTAGYTFTADDTIEVLANAELDTAVFDITVDYSINPNAL